jgi:hypothetical protein
VGSLTGTVSSNRVLEDFKGMLVLDISRPFHMRVVTCQSLFARYQCLHAGVFCSNDCSLDDCRSVTSLLT